MLVLFFIVFIILILFIFFRQVNNSREKAYQIYSVIHKMIILPLAIEYSDGGYHDFKLPNSTWVDQYLLGFTTSIINSSIDFEFRGRNISYKHKEIIFLHTMEFFSPYAKDILKNIKHQNIKLVEEKNEFKNGYEDAIIFFGIATKQLPIDHKHPTIEKAKTNIDAIQRNQSSLFPEKELEYSISLSIAILRDTFFKKIKEKHLDITKLR